MAFALNLLWFVTGGFLEGLRWCTVGLLCFGSIIGIPFGVACFRIAGFAFLPFGKELVPVEMMGGERIFGTGLMNFVWCVVFGWWLALFSALLGVLSCSSIIGYVWGKAYFAISKVSFAPLGKVTVSKDMAEVARERWNKEKLDRAFAKKYSQSSHPEVRIKLKPHLKTTPKVRIKLKHKLKTF